MRTLNTPEYAFKHANTNHRFGRQEEIAEFLRTEGRNSLPLIDIENPAQYEIDIVTDADRTHYWITIKPAVDPNRKMRGCGPAAFSDDVGVIYTGKALGLRGGQMKRFLILLLLFVPLAARAACSHEDAPYELKRTDHAYEEAMKLKEQLGRRGIEVVCVLPSKSVQIFEGQLGAAFYRTSVGVIDVMFMPESTDFKIHVVETKKDGRYLYSFDGKPHAITPGWDASHPWFFVQFHNSMFTTDDEKVAQRLQAVVLAKQPDSQRETFVSADGVFRFSYSSGYVLDTRDNEDEFGVSMFPICSERAVCVVSRREYYAGTSFQAASFQEREIHDATTEVACLRGPPEDVPTYNLPQVEQKRTIGGVVFTHGRSAEVGGGSGITSDFYRVFHRNKCYELSLSIAESSFANLDPSKVKEFTSEDEGRVQSDLMAILDSFRFL